MGLSISISYFFPILNYLSGGQNRDNLLSYRDFWYSFSLPNHAIKFLRSRYFRGSITLLTRSNHAIFEVQSRY